MSEMKPAHRPPATGRNLRRPRQTRERSRRLYRADLVAQSQSKDFDELYAYDGLNRLTDMQRGRLNTAKDAIQPGEEKGSGVVSSWGLWCGLLGWIGRVGMWFGCSAAPLTGRRIGGTMGSLEQALTPAAYRDATGTRRNRDRPARSQPPHEEQARPSKNDS